VQPHRDQPAGSHPSRLCRLQGFPGHRTITTHREATRGTGKPREARTKARLIATVASLYDHLEESELITKNPVTKKARVKVAADGATPALDADAAARLLEAARGMSDNTYLAVSTMLATGVRASGLLGIDLTNLRIEGGRLIARVTLKAGGTLDLPLPDSAADVIDRVRGERRDGPLLQGPRGGWSYDALHEACVKAGSKAALTTRTTPHVLRATWATIALSLGVSPAYVQSVMGHANIATTLGYDRRRDDLERRAEAMDKVAKAIAEHGQ